MEGIELAKVPLRRGCWRICKSGWLERGLRRVGWADSGLSGRAAWVDGRIAKGSRAGGSGERRRSLIAMGKRPGLLSLQWDTQGFWLVFKVACDWNGSLHVFSEKWASVNREVTEEASLCP